MLLYIVKEEEKKKETSIIITSNLLIVILYLFCLYLSFINSFPLFVLMENYWVKRREKRRDVGNEKVEENDSISFQILKENVYKRLKKLFSILVFLFKSTSQQNNVI